MRPMRWWGRSALLAAVIALAVPAWALADTPWTASGPGTVVVTSNGTAGPAQMTYSERSTAVWSGQSWTFSSTADTAGAKTLDYNDSGFYSWFDVYAYLDAFVTHDGATTSTRVVSARPFGPFTYTGSVTLNVQAGDTYGFHVGGSNFDSNDQLSGTLTVTPVKHPTSTSVSCSPSQVVAGNPQSAATTTCTATVTDTANSDQTPPTGTVSFASSGAGSFSDGAECTLSPAGGSSSSCSVVYTPGSTPSSATRTDTITASYGGDDGHTASTGAAAVSVISLPTSKDQCKDGGWQQYTVFKNQGDCVSFVATAGTNQPG